MASERIDDGGPAFPVSTRGEDPEDRSYGHQDSAHTWQYPGMTLRDYFAAKAIAPVLAGAVLPEESWPEVLPTVARFSYAMADAMLKARGT